MRLEGVGRRYGVRGPWVLRGVELGLPPGGGVVRVEGANGSGKSTLLRLLAGIDRPSAGRISGRPSRTAYVPERFPATGLPFTARGWLVHLGRVHGLGSGEARARAGEWLERFGAAEFAGAPLDELSKGTCQKVAVAQGLLADPGLLVLDEAWTGLDAAARGALDVAVGELAARGSTVVFVDHDPSRLPGADRWQVAAGAVTPARTAPYAVITVSGPEDAPLPPDVVAVRTGDRVSLTVPDERADEVLRELLTCEPPWSVRGVSR
ncbi:Vitamin B12 import ATP-binding protein BtuD [Streptomyces sp. RB5]|uniref:Vitamin B12 import ATP-binding protein BtuD n=1 Tax=Streptomyces smaragdinus TaxID=2585196 RepID=A0A7K0CS46_9ACTN|nr:ATP-binding cassette domain-containing protein [Streptomyces smaragdinus]MQY15554.1 Vitamin B12 import ATP-binding protein BtuD [Streptomyces smaragdinus]